MASSVKPDPDATGRSTELKGSFSDERAALAAVLASELFRRSPKISRLLAYLCDKYFSGEADEIGEYKIAVEALGRDSKFDPQLDAIVRVDTHHLRKRLKQYYAAEGERNEIEIVVPPGQYTPTFVRRAVVAATAPEPVVLPSPAVGKPRTLWQDWPWIFAVVVIALAAGLFVAVARPKKASPPIAVAAEANGDEIRILAGENRGEYTDKSGKRWLADRFFTGGTSFRRDSHTILRTQDPELFQAGREGQFAYEIPLKPGTYELRLYFAETGVTGENMRGVTVTVNGIPRSTLDVVSDAGGADTATEKIVKDVAPSKDGLLHLTFQGSPAFVNAIEISPATKGTMQPIRFTTGEIPYRDHLGRMWLPDQWFVGGRKSSRTAQITGVDDPTLYLSQRYGHFNYSIPVAEDGRYTVTMYFAETWFGKDVGGVGSRVFDVYCNGATLLKNFDIIKESGDGQPMIKTFHNLLPSPQGKLELTFVPVVNYATLSAIEVVQE